MSTIDQYAVFGDPVEHSLSPYIQAAFAKQLGERLEYTKKRVALDQFETACSEFFKDSGRGLNITVPFKTLAFAWAQNLSEYARRAEAVNTLGVDAQGNIWGDNTDGIGLVSDLKDNLKVPIVGRRILILGAGGAVRGVLWPLLQSKPAEICIANRSVEKAQALASLYPDRCKAFSLSELKYVQQTGRDTKFDVVINGTSASLSDEKFTQLAQQIDAGLAGDAFCYDMMYGAELTPFLDWCQNNNAASVADGFGMLVEQAAQAFYLWRGKKPDTSTLIELGAAGIQSYDSKL